jgi:tRNA (cmo5U34)-methyltransferase
MVKGGVLILSEKIRFEDESTQTAMTKLHHEFKRYQGYSDLEVAQKRASLENVLVPNSEQQHIQRLEQAGFETVTLIARCVNFASLMAIR